MSEDTTVEKAAAQGVIGKLVEGYITLRDKKAEIKARHEQELAPIQAMLDKIEVHILQHMQEHGVESCRTPVGTAYMSTRTSATCADWDLYRQFCQQQEDPFMFMERRVNKTAIDEYVAVHKDLPPGVNFRSEVVVNVRRS